MGCECLQTEPSALTRSVPRHSRLFSGQGTASNAMEEMLGTGCYTLGLEDQGCFILRWGWGCPFWTLPSGQPAAPVFSPSLGLKPVPMILKTIFCPLALNWTRLPEAGGHTAEHGAASELGAASLSFPGQERH